MFIHLIGSRIRDLPVCSIVQSLRYRVPPDSSKNLEKLNYSIYSVYFSWCITIHVARQSYRKITGNICSQREVMSNIVQQKNMYADFSHALEV
jgi:hypothetical protein